MSRSVVALAVCTLVIAIAVPSHATAEFLAGVDAPSLERVVAGVSILRAMLAVNALLFVGAALWSPRSHPHEPLVDKGLQVPPPAIGSAWWPLGALLLLALVLRWRDLALGISFDEIDTLVHYARKPLGAIATTFDSQNQHLLYSALAHFTCGLFGDDPAASTAGVRVPAVVLGVASIWALYRFALLVTDRREALCAAALLTVSYHHVWFSQNARGYSGLLLFTLLGSEVFLRMLGERDPHGFGRPLAYGCWMALATAIHATAAIVVAAHGLIWIALLVASRKRDTGPNRWQPALGFAFAVSLSLLLYALVLPQFFDTLLAPTMPGKNVEWKQTSWLVSETVAGLARGVPGGLLVLLAGAAVALIGIVSYLRQSIAVLATFTLAGVLMAIALVATHHNLWPRMFFFCAGFAVLIGVRGIVDVVLFLCTARSAPFVRRAIGAAMVVLCLASAATLPRVWAPKQDFAAALHYVESRAETGDAIVTCDMTAMPYGEFYGRSWPSVDNVADLMRIEALHPRTWIVYTTPTRMKFEHADVWARLASDYDVQATFWGTLGGSEVVVAATKPKN
jgi:hypothetical protein